MQSDNTLQIKKIAFFDFCNTLVSFQTADPFIDYVRKLNGNYYMRFLEFILQILIKSRIIAIFNKFMPDFLIEKKLKLIQLRGMTHEKLDFLARSYYKDMIKPNMIESIITELKILENQGYEICIVSAGYSIYLKYFIQDFQIRHIISTEIEFNEETKKCSGFIKGRDCTGHQKKISIYSYFPLNEINFKDCISFSDSIGDLPMLLLTGKAVVVSRSFPQSWAHRYKFKEIIW